MNEDDYNGCRNCLVVTESRKNFFRHSCRSFGPTCQSIVPEYISHRQEYDYIKLKVKKHERTTI